MSSNLKRKQTKIDHFFKRVSKDECCNKGFQVDVDAQKYGHLSDDDVVFEKQVLHQKRVKRKASTSKSIIKVPNIVKNDKPTCINNYFQSVREDCEIKVQETSSLSKDIVISTNDKLSFTKLKPHKENELNAAVESSGISKIEKDANHTLCENHIELNSQLCNKVISEDFIQETSSPLKHKLENDLNNSDFKEKINVCTESVSEEALPQKPKALIDRTSFNNFIVSSIERENSGDLKLLLKQNELELSCVLRGLWATTSIKVGDSVNVVSNNFDSTTISIDRNDGMIVVNPERLVSSTSISSAVFCMRKTWINEKFASYGSPNKYMLIGCIIHDLFQTACVQKLKNEQQLQELLNSLVSSDYVLDGCYANDVTIEKLMEDLQMYIPSIVSWLQKYVHSGPSFIRKGSSQKMKVLNVLDIEDNYWCTGLGLKGKVDVSLEVEIHEKNKLFTRNVPLELKTGQPSFSFQHQGQVSLYSMMMHHSQYTPCDSGFLLYLKGEPEMKEVEVKQSDRNALIQLRNEFINYSDDFKIGPPPINNERLCSSCDSLLPCCLMLKSFNELSLDDSEVMNLNLMSKATSHLNDNHLVFFTKWVSMIHMEISTIDQDRVKSQKYFWKERSIELEAKGLAFSNMVYEKNADLLYTFKRKGSETVSLKKNNTIIKTGDRVALSEDKCLFSNPRISFVIGFVYQIETEYIKIRLEKNLHKSLRSISIRIDLLPTEKSLSHFLTNILRLMSNDVISSKLRRFIIDGEKPVFKSTIGKRIIPICQPIVKSLNKSQQKAVLKSITANDYVLICGTPGAGKTTTVVSIIRVLVALRKSVLITSYTHSALDNILLKLKQFDIDFIRFGIHSRIHPEIQKYSLENRMKNIKSVKETNQVYETIPVVASTCLSLSHPIFEVRTFDYCLMDEASQVNLLSSLGPLFLSKKFILVGDSKQLPPVVKSKEAKEMGFDQSLFSILCEEETVSLTIQYRMNEEIMRIASKLTYDDLLECGSQQISTSTLTQRNNVTFEKPWISEVLSCDLSKSVVFVDTDQVPAPEQVENNLVFNRVEAKVVTILVQYLINNFELTSKEIGIITPYVKQVEVIRENCRHIDVEINTVDQYQGRDKDVIIISTVVNSTEKTVRELLKDKRRLNVAVTRAKKKLLIVGSRSTLSVYQPFKNLFSILKEHQVFKLPLAAHL